MRCKVNLEDLIKEIDDKIAQLENAEDPNELLKSALLKKGLISSAVEISQEKFDTLFEILKKEIDKEL